MQKYILILFLFSGIIHAAQEAYPFQLVQVGQPIPVATLGQADMFFNKLSIADEINADTDLIPDLSNIAAEYAIEPKFWRIDKRLTYHPTNETLKADTFHDYPHIMIYKSFQAHGWYIIAEKTNIFSTKHKSNFQCTYNPSAITNYSESSGHITHIYWQRNTNYIFVASFFKISYSEPSELCDDAGIVCPLSALKKDRTTYTYGEIFKFKLVPTV